MAYHRGAMKALMAFVAGLAIGAAVMFGLKPDHAAEADAARESERVVRERAGALETELEKTRAEVARAGNEADSLRLALDQTTAKATEAATAAKLNLPPDESAKRQNFADMIKRIGTSQVQGQLDAKVAAVKDRLKLTPAQEARLQEMVKADSAEMARALERFVDGEGGPGDFGKLARLQRGDLPAEVESMLTAEQRPLYAEFQAEEKANRIEMKANAELIGLQAAGGLTPEQKDQAFAVLSGFAADEDDVDFESMKDGEAVLGFVDDAIGRRVEAMKPILSGPQMDIYQRQIEMQRQMMSQFLPPPQK
jgi:hypothetical protein